ncbi:MAG: DUF362 domain-containing protein [Planctomycetes bacterium]|nr:DUF362 domain-containing protein [Planctomycetota bacterium]
MRRGYRWVWWLSPAAGLLALIWFLIRVVPKPSRATYPCQRVAMPLASGFVAWLVVLVGSMTLFPKFGRLLRRSRLVLVGICLITVAIVAVGSWAGRPEQLMLVQGPWGPHGPIGEAKGIHPGRVVWVYDPNATDWEGYNSSRRWWQNECTNLEVVERMLSQVIQGVADANSDAAAWDAIFRYFNAERGNGDVGYQRGEKIAIKINLTTCNAYYSNVSPVTYEKNQSVTNNTDNSPQMTLALLRQLVHIVGVDQNDISIGDPTAMIPNYWWDIVHPEFPNVRYLDTSGGAGRTRVEFSNVPFYWSTPEADRKKQDYIPAAFAEAAYIINFAILKGHSSGVTLCAKNHYGSLIRTPDGRLRPSLPLAPDKYSFPGYYDMHLSLPNANQNPPWSPGTARYRGLVDLMGHPELGGKTLLYLLDGLYGGYYADSHPYKWKSAPFNGDWPSSIFASQDPVAIDSVGYDFVNEEWPDVVKYGHSPNPKYDLQGGAEDYLHEAALANDPCSGTFYDPDHSGIRLGSLGVHEHWNNATDKQYSRNLGAGPGIELIQLSSRPVPGDMETDGVDELAVLDRGRRVRAHKM